MDDNLVFFINKLSYVIVSQYFESDSAEHSNRKDECCFNKCLKRVRQIGCDVLLKKMDGTPLEDPCVTDYGGNWSPVTLITDYGRELQAQGANKYNEMLLNAVRVLQEKQYDSFHEILKFLLLLKKPLTKETSGQLQKELSFSGSNSLLQAIESESFALEDCPRDGLSRTSSHKRALRYEESWTKHFDAKFQLLGEYSKKNLTPDKVSLNSLFPSRPLVNSQSRSNSFVFPDFSRARNYRSEKSLFNINSNAYIYDSPLLDNFVDHPITHKLPALSLNPKFSSKNGFLAGSGGHSKLKYPSFPEETAPTSASPAPVPSQVPNRSSVIELKRNSNCSHSFAILYQKSAKSGASSSGSGESLLVGRGRRREGSVRRFFSSRDVVLGLWEQEQNLLKEFRPELAAELPTLRMISLVEYVEDVKYLFTGIDSGTFAYRAEEGAFKMVYGTCLEDVTPESLFDFSKEFLEIGNCYVKLNSRVKEFGKNNFDTCTTISQAFWKSIFDLLELHYSLVLDIPFSVNLLALKSCTKDVYEIITTVANICKVLGPEEALPEGGKLLTYLLEVAEKINRQSVINVVFGILQNCCSVYFMCILQNWMFKGRLDSESDEFFVSHRRQKVKTKSRAYYNSFYLIEERIPSFLRGYEESIFNCGKSVHFLKLFNAEDKLCQLLEKAEYPNMYVCFSEEQFQKLEKEFKSYEERVIRSCGEKITIRQIREEEKEKERAYIEYVKECKALEEERREKERLKQLEEAKAAREKQNQLLNEQLNEMGAERERRRREEEEEKAKLEEQIKRAESQQENIVNMEKNLLKSYYDQLMGSLNRELTSLRTRKEGLLRIFSGELTEDVVNDNVSKGVNDNVSKGVNDNVSNVVETDAEGNVTNQSDINSNINSESEVLSEALTYVAEAKFSELLNSRVSVEYDVNSNPRMTSEMNDANANSVETVKSEEPERQKQREQQEQQEDQERKQEDREEQEQKQEEQIIRRSVSHRTVAAAEAERNKCKILRSEFALPVRKSEDSPQRTEAKAVTLLSDLERNKRKVLESEYNLLRNPTHYVSLKSVPHNLQLAKEDAYDTHSLKTASDSLRFMEFESVGLERKSECMSFDNPIQKPPRNDSTRSDSSDSFLTPSNDFSTENVSNTCEDFESLRTPGGSSMILNEKYQDALTLDMNVFYHKISHQHIFCSLKDEELDSLPCTDFTVFGRCLRKSALVPLKVQEKLANDALLKHLLQGENLLGHLRSLRGYFFLNDGEFGRSFTHHTFRSLAKCSEPTQFFERNNLGNIVNEALNYTIHSCEPNAQNLSFRIVKMPPFLNHASHDVLSPFELSYKVAWPLTVILTEKALSKYKTVFRFLLKLKRINWTLNENFLYLNSHFKSRRLKEHDLTGSPHYHKIQIYRHAMTQVMITLDDYIFSNGVQFPWIFFLKDLETTENIDHLYQKHVRYIKDVLTRCFLSKNSEDLLECIHSMIELALKFHYTAKSSALVAVDGRYEHPKFSVLKTTFNEFCSVIKTFLKTLKEKISSNQVLESHYILIEKFDLKLT